MFQAEPPVGERLGRGAFPRCIVPGIDARDVPGSPTAVRIERGVAVGVIVAQLLCDVLLVQRLGE